MSDDLDSDGRPTRKRMGAATGALLAAPVGLAMGAVGLFAGLALGAALMWMFSSTKEIEVQRAPTAEELAAACAPVIDDGDALGQAQGKVATLERDVAEQERRVHELEGEMARRSDRGKEMVAEFERLKSELATTKEALVVAEREKEKLLVELRQTKEELAVTTRQRDVAKEDALYNRWTDFLKNAQLEICDKGNRKRLGNCRETVEATLVTEARQTQFSHCVRSGQAAPMVIEQEGNTLPAFAQMIDEEQKQTRGWMVVFCDPTLPERADAPLATSHLAE